MAEGGEGVDVTLDGRGADAGEMAGEVLAAGGDLGCTGGLSFPVGTAFGNAGVDLVDHGVSLLTCAFEQAGDNFCDGLAGGGGNLFELCEGFEVHSDLLGEDLFPGWFGLAASAGGARSGLRG